MTTISLPISREAFSLTLPELEPRKLNWMGGVVQWIRKSKEHGLVHKVTVYTLALLVSFVLVVSVVLSPLFIYGFKEYIRQCERARFDKKHGELLHIAKDYGKHQFLLGRLAPLDETKVSLWNSIRKRIVRDLELKEDEAKKLKDTDLVRMVAAKYHDYLKRYSLQIK